MTRRRKVIESGGQVMTRATQVIAARLEVMADEPMVATLDGGVGTSVRTVVTR